MSVLVIYHDSCVDCFGAAFAAWKVFGANAEYLPANYDMKTVSQLCNATKTPIDNETAIYILDFSFPRDVMEYLFAHAKQVVWLDHHKTAFEMWCLEERQRYIQYNYCDKHTIILDNNKSGAMLAWEYFNAGEPPMIIKHIDDYDRWQFKLEGTKKFNKAIWSYAPWSFEQWNNILEEEKLFGLNTLYRDGELLLKEHNRQVEHALIHQMKCCISHPYGGDNDWVFANGLAVNCPSNLTSDVGHELANESKTFGLCWHMDDKGAIRCSLRSNGDYDVSAIAKTFGGGGHKNAAGFTVLGSLDEVRPVILEKLVQAIRAGLQTRPA